MQTLRSEVRIAVRRLLRAPAFSIVTIATLALGIGAAAAIYTLFDAIVLRPLPYSESDRLVRVQHPVPGHDPEWVWELSEAGYHHFAQHTTTLEALAVYSSVEATLNGDDGAEQVDAVQVSASMFQVLRASPALGRLLRPEENLPGAAPVALLGYDFWQSRFGGDSSVVGRTVLIAERPHEVVGVLGPGFHMPDDEVSVWLPFPLNPAARPMNSHWLAAIGRLRDGVTPAAAEAELAQMTATFPALYRDAYSPEFMQSSRFSVRVTPLRDIVVGDAARVLWILLGSVAVVLLIALANVANLFLVRAEGRRRELAVRTALGATTGSLARHYLIESLLLAGVAAVAAVWLAHEGLALLVALAPDGVPRLGEVEVGARSVLACAALAVAAGTLLGLLPLARMHGGAEVVRESGRGLTASRRQHAVRGALVTAQVALALVLLAASGLMLHSFRNLRAVSPGFDPRGVLAVDIALPDTRYGDYESVAGFYRELAARIDALPGVTGSGMTQRLPLAVGVGCASVFVKDKPLAPGEMPPCVGNPQVGPGFFDALGIPVRGAAPGWTDTYRRAGEVVISQALAERLWPGEDALGKELRGAGPTGPHYRVVGVAGDVRQDGLDQPPAEAVYYPLLPLEGAPLWMPAQSASLVVRTELARPAELAPAIRQIVRELDRGAATAEIRPMTAVVARSMARVSFTLVLIGIAGTMALVLSAVGLYGVLAYMVSRRTSEIGIRMALGARAEQVVGLVLGHSVRLVAAGIVIGVAIAALTLRALRAILFGVEPLDPITLGAAAAVLLAVGVLAAWLPARRATQVSPVTALQSD